MASSPISFGDIYTDSTQTHEELPKDMQSLRISSVDNLDDGFVNVVKTSGQKELVCGPDAPTYEGKVKWFESVLLLDNDAQLDRHVLSDYVMKHGVPDRPQLRSLTWKLLLGYLPFDKSEWAPTLKQRREIYGVWLKEFIANPYDDIMSKKSDTPSDGSVNTSNGESLSNKTSTITRVSPAEDPLGQPKMVTVKLEDDPLSPTHTNTTKKTCSASPSGNGSEESEESVKNKWLEYYKDEEIRAEVDKDVQRTYSSLHFFQLPAHPDDVQSTSPTNQVASSPASPSPSSALSTPPPTQASVSSTSEIGLGEAQPPQEGVKRQKAKFDDDLENDDGLFGDYNPNRHQLNDMGTLRVQEVVESTTRPLCHHDVLRRLLFLYAKLNPGVRYVQGMNEILAPIYYIFASDPDYYTVNHGQSLLSKLGKTSPLSTSQQFSDAEADAFFCFSNLMAHIRDRFIKSLDHAENGVMSIISRYDKTLSELDPELWHHFQQENVDPRFYSFRWLTLLMSQDFQLPDVLRLWDSIFADDMTDTNLVPTSLGREPSEHVPTTHTTQPTSKKGASNSIPANRSNIRFDIYLCCAMVISLRDQLLDSEFTEILSTLQQYPATDVELLLVIANELRKAHQTNQRSRYVQSTGRYPHHATTIGNPPQLTSHPSNSSSPSTSRNSSRSNQQSTQRATDIPLGSSSSPSSSSNHAGRPSTSRANSTGNSITKFFRNAFH